MTGKIQVINQPALQIVEAPQVIKPEQVGRLPGGQGVIIIENDRNTLKGLAWGALSLGFGGSGFGAAGLTALSLVLFPPAVVPTGISTYVLYRFTKASVKNMVYHFSQPPIYFVK